MLLGTFVASVSAADDDATAPNNEIVYRIEGGGLDRFIIDPTSGKS